jgi:hypothetical protein
MSPMTSSPDSAPEADAPYTYRPSLLGAPWSFRLMPEGLAWEVGRKTGYVAYRDIRRLRLSFRPASMQSQRYLTEIWAEGAPKLEIMSSSWKSMVEQQRLDKPYSAFVAELHRRLAAVGSTARFEQGSTPWRYWPGLTLFTGVGLGLAFLVVRALEVAAWAGAAFIAGFLLLFLWQGGNFFRRNRPGLYRADAPPSVLMP